jgi:tetratricopeptide (TPR) repeat protein
MANIPEDVERIVLNPPQNPIRSELGQLAHLKRGSFKIADRLASQGKWRESAAHYNYFVHAFDHNTSAEGMLGIMQMSINIGDFQRAANYGDLDSFFKMHPEVRTSIKDQYLVKKAWTQEMMGDPLASLESLNKIYGLKESDPLYWSVVHFKGRAKLLEGLKTQDSGEFIVSATEHFVYGLRHAEESNAPLNEGFNHIWLARCSAALGNLESAYESAHKAWVRIGDANGNMGEQYQLCGELFAKDGALPDSVRWHAQAFNELNKTQHKTAAAEAAWGLTKALSAQGEGVLAAKWSKYALVTYPYIFSRLYI